MSDRIKQFYDLGEGYRLRTNGSLPLLCFLVFPGGRELQLKYISSDYFDSPVENRDYRTKECFMVDGGKFKIFNYRAFEKQSGTDITPFLSEKCYEAVGSYQRLNDFSSDFRIGYRAHCDSEKNRCDFDLIRIPKDGKPQVIKTFDYLGRDGSFIIADEGDKTIVMSSDASVLCDDLKEKFVRDNGNACYMIANDGTISVYYFNEDKLVKYAASTSCVVSSPNSALFNYAQEYDKSMGIRLNPNK